MSGSLTLKFYKTMKKSRAQSKLDYIVEECLFFSYRGLAFAAVYKVQYIKDLSPSFVETNWSFSGNFKESRIRCPKMSRENECLIESQACHKGFKKYIPLQKACTRSIHCLQPTELFQNDISHIWHDLNPDVLPNLLLDTQQPDLTGCICKSEGMSAHITQ